MDRPEYKDYEYKECLAWGMCKYGLAMQKYCDELEKKLEIYDILVEVSDVLYSDVKELNKALNKACEELHDLQYMGALKSYEKGLSAKEWKEYLLKDGK